MFRKKQRKGTEDKSDERLEHLIFLSQKKVPVCSYKKIKKKVPVRKRKQNKQKIGSV